MSASLSCSTQQPLLCIFLRFFISFCFACLTTLTFAAPPQTINYQGYLTSPGGTPVNSAVVMTFKLYNAASGGAALYSETQLSVNVSNGNFNAVVGAVTPITLPFDVPYWLTVAINSDPEMSPRQPLASSPYAFRAASLDSTATLAGSQISGTISAAQIANNAVTQAKLSPVSGAAAGKVLGTDGTNLQWQTASVGTITGVTAGTGLTGGGSSGGVTLAVDTSTVQSRVTGTCAAGLFVTGVNSNGSVVCGTDTGGNGNISGNLSMPNSTASVGNLLKGGLTFLHNFGTDNTFVGKSAGNFTLAGASGNVAIGAGALSALTSGDTNVAVGPQTLELNTSGFRNTAIGNSALYKNTTGNLNIAVGDFAGSDLTTGTLNIAIGNVGVAGESSTIRVGNSTFQTRTFIAGIRGITTTNANAIPVLIDSAGQLGTVSSSRRFKDDIADMNTASSALMSLRPVTFHYKTDQNPAGRTLQYGLIAEEVNEIYPGLVAHSADGQIETVMYQHLPPMLLNEFQKQQRRINALERELQEIKALLLAR